MGILYVSVAHGRWLAKAIKAIALKSASIIVSQRLTSIISAWNCSLGNYTLFCNHFQSALISLSPYMDGNGEYALIAPALGKCQI